MDNQNNIDQCLIGSIALQKAVFFEEIGMSIAQITGKDVIPFLNRITTIKPQQLQQKQGSLAFILSAKGDVKAAFELLRREQGFYILVNTQGKDQLKEMLEYYHFSEDITLTFLDKQVVSIDGACADQVLNELGILEQLSPPRDFPLSFDEDEKKLVVRHHRLGVLGFDIWVNPHAKANLLHKLQHIEIISEHCHIDEVKALSYHAFEGLRKRQGLASFPQEYRFIPLEISKNGITELKGCYPGQEVIERMIALGKPAKEVLCLVYLKSHSTEVHAFTAGHKVYQEIDQQLQEVGECLDLWENEHIALISTRVKPNLKLDHLFYDANHKAGQYLRHFS